FRSALDPRAVRRVGAVDRFLMRTAPVYRGCLFEAVASLAVGSLVFPTINRNHQHYHLMVEQSGKAWRRLASMRGLTRISASFFLSCWRTVSPSFCHSFSARASNSRL